MVWGPELLQAGVLRVEAKLAEDVFAKHSQHLLHLSGEHVHEVHESEGRDTHIRAQLRQISIIDVPISVFEPGSPHCFR
eukprot:2874846-Amphidinium_carterae.1